MSDREFLEWIRDRIVHVYGESPNVDFVQKLGKIVAQVQAGSVTKNQISEGIFGWGLRNDDGHNLSMDDTDEIAEYIMRQAAQAQAGDGESPVGWLVMVDGYYKFFAIYDDALDARKHEEYWNKGLAQEEPKPVYTRPQPQVNQQLLEALKDARSALRYIRETHGELYGVGFDRVESSSTAAIAAAQEGE